MRIAVRGQPVDHGTAGISEAEQFGDLVERFTGRIVARSPQQFVNAPLPALRTGAYARR